MADPAGEHPSFALAVAGRAEAAPDGELVRLAGRPGWTAAALWQQALAIAGGLARTVGPGDAVATILPAGPQAVAVTAALSALGAVELPLPAEVDERWARRLAAATGCALTITTAQRPPFAGRLGRLVTVDGSGGVPLAELIADGRRVAPRRLDPGAPALVMSTSGTTGRPKGAVLPVAAGPAQAARVWRAMRYDAGDVLYNCFPWHHINARHAAFLPAVLAGARLVVERRFSAGRFLETARAEGVTAFNFMGALCAMLLRQPPSAGDRDHRIDRAYGGPAPAAMVAAMAERFGVTLLQAYACTELGDVSVTTAGEVRPGAAGRPVADYRLRVVDPAGQDVAPGEPGELLVRPARPHLTFLRYAGDPEATARAWVDGWFRTRDRVRLVDGWLHFEGRCADVVRRRGISISPGAVEEVIATMPGVTEVAVVGVPSELTEDEVFAVVVPGPAAAVDPAAVRRYCADRLPRHALPRYVSIEEALPRNANLKVSRAALRDRGIPAGVWDAERDREPGPEREHQR
jgi:carnitine-CoA ligase